MQHSTFVSLHLHSEYSLLDGAIRIGDLVKLAKEYHMPAVAVTDHGNMFGAVEFYTKAVKAGVKPILGCEVYVAPDSRLERSEHRPFHLVLLARTMEGYRNLIAMVSASYLEGFHKRPRIDKALLKERGAGLIGLSACLQGEVPYHIRQGNMDAARASALEYVALLGEGNFYFELQDNGLEEQKAVNEGLIALSRETGIGLVATNDCHYLREADRKAHEVLLCIQTGTTMSDEKRFKFRGEGYWFRSPAEMEAAFAHVPEAIANTRLVAERCNVELPVGGEEFFLPKIKSAEGKRPREMMDALARIGLRNRVGDNPSDEYLARLDRELEVIKKMGYSSYFLIVSDFIGWAKKNGIPVGPGRGSAAGSLVAYSLGITDLDPIRYGLLFERFLNPERISMPDIDVDFCKDKRGRVIEYVSETYGADHVAQIITFNTMAAKAAIRDVARAMDFPYADADKIAKLVPDTIGISLKQAIDQEQQLKDLYKKDARVTELLDIAMSLEGLSRNCSTHAAGVVISPEPLTTYAPLYKSASDDTVVLQFDMESVEKIGLIKFDFLGLKTLTVIEKCLALMSGDGIEIDSMESLPLDDRKTFEFLGTGQSTGVFQLESDGMKDILVKMKPNRFEDLIALVALYRPGPIKSGMVDDFIKRKKGTKEIAYPLPEVKGILEETYGVILYQEQVMQIANVLAGYSLGQADVLRKAMGKKKADVMAEQKEIFIQGAVKHGHNERVISELFDTIANFAEYGFNKSHSAAYALISYQTAYLKAHYPVHFMAATMTADIDNSEKVVKSIKECRNMGVEILPPDVNVCGREFTVDRGNIRFGLGAVKGVGSAAVDAIMEVRSADGPFRDVDDYLRRTSGTKVNKKVTESLIKAGAFDSLMATDGSVPALGQARARAMDEMAQGGASATLSLFGGMDDASGGPVGGDGGWDEAELLKNEKDALGFFISGNPLKKYGRVLGAMGIRSVTDLLRADDGQEVEAAGIIMTLTRKKTKKGDTMAILSVEDESTSVEVVVFPKQYLQAAAVLDKDMPVIFKGKLEKSDKGIKVTSEEVTPLEQALESRLEGRRAIISVPPGTTDLKPLRALVAAHEAPAGLAALDGCASDDGPPGWHAGSCKRAVPLYLLLRTDTSETLIQTALNVTADMALVESVEGFFGHGTLKVV